MVVARGRDRVTSASTPTTRVTAGVQRGAGPAAAAPGVEHPRAAGEQRVDEAGLTVEIGALRGQPPEARRVPGRVAAVVLGEPARSLAQCSAASRISRGSAR